MRMIPPANFLARLIRMTLFPALLLGSGVVSASPRGDVLRYVPADSALCVLLEGMRERGNALAASPFLAKLKQTPLGKSASALDEVKKLLALETQIERVTGLSSQALRDDVLGDLVVLAYKPGPPGKPEQEQGLVLVHARDPKALAKMVQHINDVQKKSGELKSLEERTHRGVPYMCRVEKDAPTFYALRGSVLIFSGQEAMLKRALELNADLKPDAVAPLEQALQKLGVAGSLFTLWINPRAYDGDLAAKLARAQGNDANWLKTLEAYWKALDGIAVALQLDADVTVSLAVSGRPEQLPSAARSLLSSLAEPSRLWRTLPDDPLLAVAARLDFKALFDLVIDFLPAEGRQGLIGDLERSIGATLGKDFVREVLPALGPDLALFVLPPTRDQKGFFPQVMLALRVKPSSDPAPVDQALLSGVQTVATVVLFGHNQKNPGKLLTLKRVTLDKLDIRYLSGEQVFPQPVQPAYALARGSLVLAGSPEVLRALSALLPDEVSPDVPPPGPLPLVRVSFSAWRTFLEQRKDEIERHLVAEGARPEEAKAQIKAWIDNLEYLDRLEVRQQPAPGRMLLQVSLRPRWPLK
jgi:hypothetical protein